jgi:hypothetical protein
MENTFNEWISSFSGCDGGQIESDTWLCGIEWGYKDATNEQREEYYKIGLLNEIRRGHVKLDSKYDFFTDESFKHQYNLKFYKLYTAIFGESNKKELLKLNLSPIAFREDDIDLWNEDIVKATGIETKNEYIQYLAKLARFKDIRDLHRPKLIICTGVTHRDNFSKAFFSNTEINYSHRAIKPESENNQRVRNIYFTKHDNTHLVVIPFLGGSNGLNSDFLLNQVALEIKSFIQ